MGLDITAYRQLTPATDVTLDEDFEPHDAATGEYLSDVFVPWINTDFPGRENGVLHRRPYRYANSMGFRASSYGGYSVWREMLSETAGYPPCGGTFPHHNGALAATGGPFWELLNFSDCEGVIGPNVAEKLAKDFQEFQAQADAWQNTGARDIYADFRAAFEMAADDGAVDFH